MVIFNSYVSLSEGNQWIVVAIRIFFTSDWHRSQPPEIDSREVFCLSAVYVLESICCFKMGYNMVCSPKWQFNTENDD